MCVGVLGANESFLPLAHFHPRIVNVSVSESSQARHGDALIYQEATARESASRVFSMG